MARINTNVSAVVAQRHLNTAYGGLNQTIQRLSTGLRITRGADDPAGLIISERLRSEIAATNQAIANTQRASTIVATTEGALDEVARLLNDIQDLIVESANRGAVSEDEIRANQLQVDSAIASITRIANSTSFAGRQLLNGSLDYVTSGVDTAVIDALHIHGAQFGTRPYIPVNIEVTQSAQHATLFFTAATVTGSGTIEVMGNEGVATVPYTNGTTASAMVDAINLQKDATGVSASLFGGGFVMESVGLGTRQFVQVRPLGASAPFPVQDETGAMVNRDEGRDAITLINGTTVVGDGNHLTLKSATLDMEVLLDGTFGLGTTAFAITTGGALFQVGPEVNSNLQVNLGVRSVSASNLGNNEIGFLSQIVSGEAFSLIAHKEQEAQDIVGEALRQVSLLRGRLGAFEKNTLDTNKNNLGITMENLMAAQSNIRDADYAMETSQLSRSQILVSAGTSVLALAQQTPQGVLRLLGG